MTHAPSRYDCWAEGPVCHHCVHLAHLHVQGHSVPGGVVRLGWGRGRRRTQLCPPGLGRHVPRRPLASCLYDQMGGLWSLQPEAAGPYADARTCFPPGRRFPGGPPRCGSWAHVGAREDAPLGPGCAGCPSRRGQAWGGTEGVLGCCFLIKMKILFAHLCSQQMDCPFTS